MSHRISHFLHAACCCCRLWTKIDMHGAKFPNFPSDFDMIVRRFSWLKSETSYAYFCLYLAINSIDFHTNTWAIWYARNILKSERERLLRPIASLFCGVIGGDLWGILPSDIEWIISEEIEFYSLKGLITNCREFRYFYILLHRFLPKNKSHSGINLLAKIQFHC